MADNQDKERALLGRIRDLEAQCREQDGRIADLTRQLRDGVFCGKGEIMQSYGWSEYVFGKWVKMGLPCLIVDRTYYAHKDNINEFFRAVTRKTYANAPDDIIDGGK